MRLAVVMRFFSVVLSVVAPTLAKAIEMPGFTQVELFTEPRLFQNNTITLCVTQMPEGSLLLGGSEGLFAFDGSQWTALNVDGVNDVMGLTTDADGRVMVGTFEHFGYLERRFDGQLALVSLRRLLPPEFAETRLFFMPTPGDDGVYFVSFHSIIRWDRGQRVDVWKVEDFFPYLVEMGGEVFVSDGKRGLFRVRGSELEPVPGLDETPVRDSKDYKITGATPFRGGWLLTTQRDGFRFFDGERISRIELPGSAAVKASAGVTIKIGSLEGGRMVVADEYFNLCFLDAEGAMLAQWAADSYPGHLNTGLFVDREKRVWASVADGVMRIDWDAPLRVLDQRAGWKEPPSGMVAVGDRRVFPTKAGTHEWVQGAHPGSGTLPYLTDLPDLRQVLHVVGEDIFYLDGYGEELRCRYADGAIETLLTGSNWDVIASARNRDDLVYVSNNTGVVVVLRKTGGRWRQEGERISTSLHFTDIVEGARHIWLILGEGRIARASRQPLLEDVTVFDARHGLGAAWISAFEIGGEMRFGTQAGICYLDEEAGQFTPDPRFASLPSEIAHSIMAVETDAEGNIWVSAREGAGILRKRADGAYSWDNGALSALGAPLIHTIQRDEGGWMWCRTSKAIFAVRPEIGREEPAELRVHLAEVRDLSSDTAIFGAYRSPAVGSPEFEYARNALQFEVSAPEFMAPERTEFQYWLEGEEPGWSDWTRQRVRRHPALSEGRYVFRFRARNAHGAVAEGAPFGFSVRPPVYRTLPAYLGYALVGMGAIWGGSILYSRRLRRRNRKLEQLVNERTADLERVQRELLDASRLAGMSQVARSVVHNVGNALNSVNVSATLIDDHVRRSKLEKLAKLAALFREHESDLAEFLARDAKGRTVTSYLTALTRELDEERGLVAKEVAELRKHVEQIKEIVAQQQAHAHTTEFIEPLDAAGLMDDAWRLNRARLDRGGVEVEKRVMSNATVLGQRGKVLEILVTLLQNAAHACGRNAPGNRLVTLGIGTDGEKTVRLSVSDNGPAIPPEEAARMFNADFAGPKTELSFELHEAANAATEMDGALMLRSDAATGRNVYTLVLPAGASPAK